MAASAAADAPDVTVERSPLQQLIDRAQAASDRMSATNPTRGLLLDLSVALVAQARMLVDQGRIIAGYEQAKQDARIILP